MDERSKDLIWSEGSIPRPFGPVTFPLDRENYGLYHLTRSQHSSPVSRDASFHQTRRDVLKSISSHLATILITLLVVTGRYHIAQMHNILLILSTSSFSALPKLWIKIKKCNWKRYRQYQATVGKRGSCGEAIQCGKRRENILHALAPKICQQGH